MRSRRRWAIALIVAVAGCSGVKTPPLQVVGFAPLPPLTTAAKAAGRDAGYSARSGDRIVWLFGDTFPDDTTMLCATAAWSDVRHPTRLEEATDAAGRPSQLYELSAEERAFNAAREDPPSCCRRWPECKEGTPYCHCGASTDCSTRIALWPGSVFAVAAGRTVSYYEKVRVGVAPYDFEHLGSGIAWLDEGQTVARRQLDAAGKPHLVFTADEPNFFRGVVAEEPDGAVVYAYARTNRYGCVLDVLVSRVELTRIGERTGYRFWDGTDWTPELDEARPILSGVVAGLGTVSWNRYLGAYLAAEADLCTGGNRLLLRTAPRPEGPWSEPLAISLARAGAETDAYAAILHPELDRGRQAAISFYQPQLRGEEILGRVRLFYLTLLKGSGARLRYPRTHPIH